MKLAGLLTARGISLLGSRMSFLALPWLALVLTGSPVRAGLVGAAEMLPYVVASALGGPLVDRFGIRRAAIAANLVSAGVMAAIPFAYRYGFEVLLVLVAVAGALRGLGDNATEILLPAVVADTGTDMTRATSLLDGVSRLATMLGAPAGGVLIAWLGADRVLYLDALSFVACAAVLASVVRVGAVRAERPEPYFAALRTGFAYSIRDRLLLSMVGMLFLTNLLDQAYGAVFAPVWAFQVTGSAVALGLLSGSAGLGAVLGNVVFTALAPRLPRYATFTLAFLICGSPRYVVLAFADAVPGPVVVGFLCGLGAAALNPILSAVYFERVPGHLLSRVYGLTGAVSWAGIPLGGLLGGWAAQSLGLRGGLLLAGAAYLFATLLPVFGRRTWRDLDRRPDTPEPTRTTTALAA